MTKYLVARNVRFVCAFGFIAFCVWVAFASVAQPSAGSVARADTDRADAIIRAGLAATLTATPLTASPTSAPKPTLAPKPAFTPVTIAATPAKAAMLHPISQQDRAQYISDDEYKAAKDSACSMAAAAMVLAAYGKTARITDLAYWMRTHNAPTTDGLTMETFSTFATKLPAAFGMRGIARTDNDLDKHIGQIGDYLRKGVPVMADIYDPTWFPSGHWIVLTEIVPKADLTKRTDLPRSDYAGAVDFGKPMWDDDAVVILNPDPGRRDHLPVAQLWPLSRFRQFFGAVHLSVVYLTLTPNPQ